MNDGGPAFPYQGKRETHFHEEGEITQYVNKGWDGMSLRDWFAGKALPTLIALHGQNTTFDQDDIAKWAYSYAESMLKVRNDSLS